MRQELKVRVENWHEVLMNCTDIRENIIISFAHVPQNLFPHHPTPDLERLRR
jgi:hypothetical protein